MGSMPTRSLFGVSIGLSILMSISSGIGLFTPDFYFKETLNWQAQSLGQDAIDLFLIVPVLLITSWLAWRNNKTAEIIKAGVLLYIIYTFTIYCFDVHFNSLFLIYCAVLGLSFYSFLHFLFTQTRQPVLLKENHSGTVIKITAVYLLIISTVFFFLWLAEIIPPLRGNTMPKSLVDAGLFTNPVHVIDLSVVLPGIFMTGIFLLRGKPLGLALAPVMLSFFMLMDITIAGLILVMKLKGLEASYTIAIAMSFLAIFSLVLLVRYLRGTLL